jgi:hypothetical protein
MKAWGLKAILIAAGAAVVLVLLVGLLVWRGDILEDWLDPKVPYQTYTPPPAPNYASAKAWALRPDSSKPTEAPADVFFVHPTTYDGGHDWNAPIGDEQADRTLTRVMLPNYAGPFARAGRVFAPRYRQASLYTFLTLREDAREARAFAYGDVEAAFRWYLEHDNHGRPLILVGVEQGGTLAQRLATDIIAKDPALIQRLAGVYLVDTVAPRAAFGQALPPCAARRQAHCVVAWAMGWADASDAATRILSRALVWTPDNQLDVLGTQPALCVNPVLGAETEALAAKRQNLGAVNATGMEWGERPPLLPHEVSAQCKGGLLRVSHPNAASLRPSGSWADRKKERDYNLFYADLEADSKARVATLMGRTDFPTLAPPIEKTVVIKASPIHRAR